MALTKPNNIDEYIAGSPKEIQGILEQVRATIKEAAPGAKETIKYAMPSFTLKGNLVYFAAFKNHVGLYPVPTGNKEFEDDFSHYKTGKGSIQFPFDKPMPLGLITKIVQFRIEESSRRENQKKRKQ
jgi:uncharacterized protein YdhG (YjbR/CyaY superfamily)